MRFEVHYDILYAIKFLKSKTRELAQGKNLSNISFPR